MVWRQEAVNKSRGRVCVCFGTFSLVCVCVCVLLFSPLRIVSEAEKNHENVFFMRDKTLLSPCNLKPIREHYAARTQITL